MKIKELYEIESGTRKRWYNYYSCDCCGSEYRKQKRLSEGATMEHYCSRECYYLFENPNNRISLVCSHCNNIFLRAKSKLNNSKSGLFFCCREHKDLGQKYIEEIQPDHYGTALYNYRKIAFRHYNHECNRCGYSIYEALEVHHIDRDRSNNDPSNLEILCANCHTLEHKGLCTGVQR